MKQYISLLLLIMSWLSAVQLTKDNCVIAFDLDDTLIEYTAFYKIKIAGLGISLRAPLKSWQYIKSLSAMKKILKKGNLDTTYPPLIGGAVLQLTYAGLQEPNLREYIPDLIQLVWDNSVFKKGIPTLLSHLHKKGYEIWIATNKDHMSYDQVLNAVDNHCTFQLRPLVSSAFVVWPDKGSLEKHYQTSELLPERFQAILNAIFTIKPTEIIHHCATPKPAKEYYDLMLKKAGQKTIIFFDDLVKNIKEAKTAGIAKSYKVKNVHDIIKQLERLALINKEDDRVLYEKLTEETTLQKILLQW